MKKYGLLGEKLTHSFSKEIHEKLGNYDYELIELPADQVGTFLKNRDFCGINVTIPYKETVIPYLDVISDVAERVGAVNTVVNRGGKLFGYNTDYIGMKALIGRAGLDLRGKKVLILGTGGTAKTARTVASDAGAAEILTVSRSSKAGSVTYGEVLSHHLDAQIIINTTPSGMYPDCEAKPLSVSNFDSLCGIIDAVYNPLRTNLVLDGRERGINAEGGLFMLVMQAVAAAEKFLDSPVPEKICGDVFADILASRENIVLTGMPGCGKSTVGRAIKLDGFEFVDTDAEIEKRCACSIKELIAAKGEEYFRDLESEVVLDAASKSRRIISTGGGAVLREKNVRALKRNGKIFFIDAPLSRLRATDSRPLSNTEDKLKKLYAERLGIYRAVADVTVPDMETAEAEAEYILSKRMELIL